MEMEQQLVPGADGDAAVVEAHDSDEEEDNCMHQDDESLVESQNLSEKGKTGSVKSWSEVISRAQRRRDQRQLRLTDNQTKQAPSPSPPGRQSRPTLRQARNWFKPLPRDHCKLVLRPRGGLNLQHILPSQLTLALLHATNTTWREANIHLQIDQAQNTATISTPSVQIGEKLIGVTDIKIKDEKHSVEIYGLAPDDSVKGVIQGVPEEFTIQEIIENIEQDGFELYAARRMGEKSTTVILTFAGSEVPRCVYLYGTAHRCTLHKKTVPVCSVCYEVGHRNTACPRPGTRACHECGTRDPGPDHTCVAKCSLCEGAHVTGAKGCSRRFVTPYVIRRREQQQRRQAQGQHQVKSQQGLQQKASVEQQRLSRRDRSSSQSRRDRSATPRRKERSTSNTGSTRVADGSRQQSRSSSRSRNKTPARSNLKQVGWSDRSSIIDDNQFPPLLQEPQKQCKECEQLKSLVAKQNEQIAKLTAQIENLSEMYRSILNKSETESCSQRTDTNARRKVPKRDIQPEQPEHQKSPMSATKDEPEWVHPMQEMNSTIAQLANKVSQLVTQMTSKISRIDRLEANVNQLLLTQKTRKGVPYAKTGSEGGHTTSSLTPNQDGASY